MKDKIKHSCIIAILIVLVLNIQSCQIDPCGSAPADLIENMEDLVKEVKKKDYKPRDNRWESYDNEFKIYFEDCFDRWSNDMTPNQKRKFATLTTRYIANRFGRSWFKSVFGKDERPDDKIPESLDQLGKDVQKFLDENTETAEEMWKDLLNDINDWFENETSK